MRWSFIFKTIGIFLFVLGAVMIFPLMVSIYFQEPAWHVFLPSCVITAATGFALILMFRQRSDGDFISQKEGMVTVALAWSLISIFGALPFYFDSHIPSFTDAVFESVSGFTTTGSTIMTNIEAAPKSLLFWRSMIQWIGGMGIIVLSLAVLPFLGVGGTQFFKAEIPSPVPDKLAPRLTDTAKILWMVYLLFTLIETALLFLGGMPLFDSICHAFTTLPTGGFSPKNASIAHYDNAYFDTVITIFMLLAGINFSLHFQLLRGRPMAFFKDTECKIFIAAVALITLAVTWNTYGSVYDSFLQAFRYAGFQVLSIITTTGFATADYEIYPGLSQALIFFCMFTGASAGSTGGGMKFARIIVCFKYCYRELFKILHPRSVRQVRMNREVVPGDVIRTILGFILLYLCLFVFASILLSATGIDLLTAISAAASCIGNIGPGFGSIGPTENFAHLTAFGKWLLSLCMLLGRLEIYTVIILFVPAFWRD